MLIRLIFNLGRDAATRSGLDLPQARADSLHDLPDAAAQYLVDRGWARREPAAPAVQRHDLRTVPPVEIRADEVSPDDGDKDGDDTTPKRKRGRPTNAERYGTT